MRLAAMITAALIATSFEALACSCARPDPQLTEEYAQNARAVFLGKAVGRYALDVRKGVPSEFANGFEVEKSWKGVDNAHISITTNTGNEMCGGYAFELGKTYLVFTDAQSLSVTNPCSPTRVVEGANEEEIKQFIDTLGAPERVFVP